MYTSCTLETPPLPLTSFASPTRIAVSFLSALSALLYENKAKTVF